MGTVSEKGTLSINSENIMPIIKKWLYSDTDIFIRELVSNGSDAVSKLRKLSSLGEAELGEGEELSVKVTVNKSERTISVMDNGIGMTADEIKKYINEIAFSGAGDFIGKYIGNADGAEGEAASGADIIGHFGLGFYSAFMVAEKVSIDTLSYKDGAEAAGWVSDGTTDYEIFPGERTGRGTTITLYVNKDGEEFLDEYKLKSALRKYCGFLPVNIYFEKLPVEIKEKTEGEETVFEVQKPEPVNNPAPLWLKKPNDCTDEEYKSFFRETFMDFTEPLFWIHLNMDYPFRLKGILYFPKLRHELESIEGQVKLYNNQVFIADNIKEVIPEFLLLLKGTIDCPDLPLNVSRSFLQNDGYVTKMSAYITKKVAEKLTGLFSDERESYNKFWDDINQFIKYGCIRDKSFYEKVSPALLYKTVAGEHLTADEILARNEAGEGENAHVHDESCGHGEACDHDHDHEHEHGGKIVYVTNEQQQAQYIKLFSDQGLTAVLMTTRLDVPYMSYIESYRHGLKFTRIDAELTDELTAEPSAENDGDGNALAALFRENIGKADLPIKVMGLKSESVSAVITLSEESRRMRDMSEMFRGMGDLPPDMFKDEETLILNKNNALIRLLAEKKGDETKKDELRLVCELVYDLAAISHKPLPAEEMTRFVERSTEALSRLL